MKIKDIFNQAPSPEEEALYRQVLEEVETGVMRKGIYAKALADGLGDEGKAQSLYIKYRVQSLVDAQRSADELQKLALAEKENEKKAKEKQKQNDYKQRIRAETEKDWEEMHPFKKFLVWVLTSGVVVTGFLIVGEYIWG